MIDERGRLFGRISIIDLGAVLIVLVAIASIFLFPGRQAGGVVQIGGGNTQPLQVDVLVRGVNASSAEPFKASRQVDLIIRNQRYGTVEVSKVEELPRTIQMVFPDGIVREVPDRDRFRQDLLITLTGQGRRTEDSYVLGNNKVKIGIPLELETFDFNTRGTVVAVRPIS